MTFNVTMVIFKMEMAAHLCVHLKKILVAMLIFL